MSSGMSLTSKCRPSDCMSKKRGFPDRRPKGGHPGTGAHTAASMMRTIGKSARRPSNGSVMSSCWRVGTSGTRIPLVSATWRVHAPAASTTTPASIGPLLVCTPVTWPPVMDTSVTSVLGSRIAPFAWAARAKPTATWAGSKYRSSPIRKAATTPDAFRNGLRRLASSGAISSTSRPMRLPRFRSPLRTSASCRRRAIFRLPEWTQSGGCPVSSVKLSIFRQESLISSIIKLPLRMQLTMPAARGEVCDQDHACRGVPR